MMTLSFTIRQTLPEDQSALEQMMVALNRHELSFAKDREIMGDAGARHMRYLQEQVSIDGGLIFVAESTDQLIGFILAHFTEIDGFYVREALRPYAEITDLFVYKDWRQQGVATALMQAVEDTARAYGYEKIRLSMHYGNKDAMKFYQALGYKIESLTLVKD